MRRFHASFNYQAASWNRKRRVVARVEWHPGELVPRVGFIVTNLTRPAERVVAFYNQRGTAEQHIKEGNNAIRWTRAPPSIISVDQPAELKAGFSHDRQRKLRFNSVVESQEQASRARECRYELPFRTLLSFGNDLKGVWA